MSISHSPSSTALQCSENAVRPGWQHTVHNLANYFKSTTKTDYSKRKQKEKQKPTSLKNTSAQWKCIQSLKSTDGNAGCNSCCFHICNLCSRVIWHIYRLNSFNSYFVLCKHVSISLPICTLLIPSGSEWWVTYHCRMETPVQNGCHNQRNGHCGGKKYLYIWCK